jgi:hypothetical protein
VAALGEDVAFAPAVSVSDSEGLLPVALLVTPGRCVQLDQDSNKNEQNRAKKSKIDIRVGRDDTGN